MRTKDKIWPSVVIVVLSATTEAAKAAATHTGNIAIVHNPDSRPCLFFQVSGVNEADPIVPGNPWFSVPQTHTGYKEIVATLLVARINGQSITVGTNGDVVCGHAAVMGMTY